MKSTLNQILIVLMVAFGLLACEDKCESPESAPAPALEDVSDAASEAPEADADASPESDAPEAELDADPEAAPNVGAEGEDVDPSEGDAAEPGDVDAAEPKDSESDSDAEESGPDA